MSVPNKNLPKNLYIPKQHFNDLLEHHHIRLNRRQLQQAYEMLDFFYRSYNTYYFKNKRSQFFSHATIYNWMVNYFEWETQPLIYVSQNIKNKDKDFTLFAEGLVGPLPQIQVWKVMDLV